MKAFEGLIGKEQLNVFLKNSEIYLAHTPDETLSDHMKLVTHYFKELVNSHGLESLIDKLLLKLCNDSVNLAEFSKTLFWKVILYHDFGKVNENFQRKLENKKNFPQDIENGIDSQHSVLSTFIFLAHQIIDGMSYLEKEDQLNQQKMICLIFALAHNILRHHSSRLDDFSSLDTFEKFTSNFCSKLESYLTCYDKSVSSQVIKGIVSLRKSNVKFEKLGFEWFALVRLNFSLLTAADYYATSHYTNKWNSHYTAFGVLTEDQKNRHFSNLKYNQSHNQKLYESVEEISTKSVDSYQEKSSTNLNRLRSKMALEVIENIRLHSDNHLFYIEAPTGGGKTNLAFIATQELLQANPELNKVFYVFPFTTLAAQTRESAEVTFGLNTEEWIELHGRAAWKQKYNDESEKDGLYGQERLDDIHNQFVNYPYTFLSHVRFFDIIKTNNKSSIYLMHRLANSVVVIDELQAYNPELWDKMAYMLKEYATAFNIRFLLMSATLPKIGTLAEAEFCYLIPNAIDRFFINPNFAQRVSFNDQLLQRKQPKRDEKKEYLEWLSEKILLISNTHRSKYGNVRTIVEFIFKKSATDFAILAKSKFADYEIFVLSGTILEPRRMHIIRELKRESNQFKNVLLITTQVVEAGVDIDMDLGFKNRSIIDSEEQLAGRVNRNVKKEDCTVYLFDLDDASVIYGKDQRFRETRNSLESEYFDILRSKRFDRLYERVKSWLHRTNQESALAGTGLDYQDRMIGQLNFPGVDKEFTLIHQNNTSIFVPLELPIKNDDQNIFTFQQLQFLKDFDIIPVSGMLSGSEVFDLYKKLITNSAQIFNEKRRNLKILHSIMSMFTFSLFSESGVLKQLISGGNREEYGYLYLTSYREVYDYELGLQDQKFDELIFL
jgi:CRISPR-associated endonuclease/helicase Cas3